MQNSQKWEQLKQSKSRGAICQIFLPRETAIMSPISTGGDGGGNAGKASLVFKEKRGKQILKEVPRDVPGGPVAKTLSSQCRGPRFDPWSGS